MCLSLVETDAHDILENDNRNPSTSTLEKAAFQPNLAWVQDNFAARPSTLGKLMSLSDFR